MSSEKYTKSMPKVALVHEYLIQYGGAEKTLEAVAELFPEAPIFTGIYDPKTMSDVINSKKIFHPKSPILSRFPKYLTFLMPLVFENFDLTEYDLIISDGTAWSKGVLTKPDQLHISYVHTPPRFLYGYSVESRKRNKWYFKPFVAVIDYFLRIWDFNAAQRPNFLVTNSNETKSRISKFYGRDAEVIYPPVDVEVNDFMEDGDEMRPEITEITNKEPYYLLLGRLSAYKNFDFVIEACNKMHAPLVVAGTGMEEKKLRNMAKMHVKFVGRVSEIEKHALLENCLGLINPVVDEDLGIVPIEAMAHGKPVLAHKSGGHLETIKEGVSGMFFSELEFNNFEQKFSKFDKMIANKAFNSNKIKDSVQSFNKDRFKEEYRRFIDEKIAEHTREQNA